MSDKPSQRASAGASGSSCSISASFLGLKAELERSKASLLSSSHSAPKRKTSASTTDGHSQKRHSSSLLHTVSSSKDKSKTKSKTKVVAAAVSASGGSGGGGESKSKGRDRGKDRATSEWASTPSAQLDTIRQNLERKARIYDQLQAGKYAGVSSKTLEEGSIDWERKLAQQPQHEREISPVADAVASCSKEEDPEVEYVDEFGRTRTARLSDVPRHLLPREYGGDKQEEEGEEDNAIYGAATSFPVYNPAPRLRSNSSSAATATRGTHFDPDFETRHRGAAFYRFATNEPERQSQMRQLAQLRQQTIANRTATAQTPKDESALKQRLVARSILVQQERLRVLGHDRVEERRKWIERQRLEALLPKVVHKAVD